MGAVWRPHGLCPTQSCKQLSPPSPHTRLPHQRALLQELVPSGAKLRSPRQLGWDLGPKQTMALLHESLREAAGAPVLFTPFVINDIFQSAQTVAEWVKVRRPRRRGGSRCSACVVEPATGRRAGSRTLSQTPPPPHTHTLQHSHTLPRAQLVIESGEDFSSVERFFVQVRVAGSSGLLELRRCFLCNMSTLHKSRPNNTHRLHHTTHNTQQPHPGSCV